MDITHLRGENSSPNIEIWLVKFCLTKSQSCFDELEYITVYEKTKTVKMCIFFLYVCDFTTGYFKTDDTSIPLPFIWTATKFQVIFN